MITRVIYYYNVAFLLHLRTQLDINDFEIYRKRVETRLITMHEIAAWCRARDIRYVTRFYWKKEYGILANLWNLYSYLRFRWETRGEQKCLKDIGKQSAAERLRS